MKGGKSAHNKATEHLFIHKKFFEKLSKWPLGFCSEYGKFSMEKIIVVSTTQTMTTGYIILGTYMVLHTLKLYLFVKLIKEENWNGKEEEYRIHGIALADSDIWTTSEEADTDDKRSTTTWEET